MLMRAEGDCMFDVYLNEKRDRLLVVARGQPIPIIGNSGRWRKKKGAVAVSDEIKLACREMASIGADGPNIEGATRCQALQLRRLPPRPRSRNDIGNSQAEARQNRRGLDPPWPVNARPGKPLPQELGILQRQPAKKQ
jgi:hypothetical protein